MSIHLIADSSENYQQFFKNSVANQRVYVFINEDNTPFLCSSNHTQHRVTPLWSDKAYAINFQKQNDLALAPVEMELSMLPRNLYLAIQHGVLVGINWTADAEEIEIDARELIIEYIKCFFSVDRSNYDYEIINEFLIYGLCFNLAFHLNETEQMLPHLQDPEGHETAFITARIKEAKMMMAFCNIDPHVITGN